MSGVLRLLTSSGEYAAPMLKSRRSLSSMWVACALNPFNAKKDAMISPLPSVNAHANLRMAFAASAHQASARHWIWMAEWSHPLDRDRAASPGQSP